MTEEIGRKDGGRRRKEVRENNGMDGEGEEKEKLEKIMG